MYKMIRDSGNYRKDFLRKEVLEKHINLLGHRERQIKERIYRIGRAKLGGKPPKDEKGMMRLIAELNMLEKKGMLSESKIKDEL